MKINELNVNESINVIECYDCKHFSTEPLQHLKVFNQVLTDGKISKVCVQEEKQINGYSIGRNNYCVNILNSKNIYLKDFSYAVVLTIGEEWRTVGIYTGFFYLIKNIDIYLRDKKDKKALREAKRVIKNISILNSSVNYNTLFAGMTGNKGFANYNILEDKDSVYTLKRK